VIEIPAEKVLRTTQKVQRTSVHSILVAVLTGMPHPAGGVCS
jgi:hypothetical protein